MGMQSSTEGGSNIDMVHYTDMVIKSGEKELPTSGKLQKADKLSILEAH